MMQGKLTTPVETQTGYLLALGFDLLPEPLRRRRLPPGAPGRRGRRPPRAPASSAPRCWPRCSTASATPISPTVLFKETYPSWFFSIHQGATTMWERWNSYSHADGFGDAGMNSFNHYAYGAIGQWMYERIAGLAPDPAQPGYKHFFIQPQPGGPLTRPAPNSKPPMATAQHHRQRLEGATILGNGGKPAPRIEDGHALIDLGPGDHASRLAGADPFFHVR
jgi:alpha-L-rhamnosidase